MENNLFVGGFPYETSEQDLRRVFGAAGTVVGVKILLDRATGRSRGLAFVEMSTEAEAQTAKAKLDGTRIGERKIFVAPARPKEGGFEPSTPRYDGPERRSGRDRRAGWGPKGERREGKPFGERKSFGDRKPFGERKSFGDKKAFGAKPDFKKKDFHGGKPKKKWGAGGPGSGQKPGQFKRKVKLKPWHRPS